MSDKIVSKYEAMVQRHGNEASGAQGQSWMDDVRFAVASVDESSRLARSLFTYFLTAGLFVAVTVGGTTDRDLLLDSPVSLPIVGTDVPLTAFFALAPLLLVIFHLNLLIKLWHLKLKAGTREEALPEGEARKVFRELLFPFDFTTLVAGPERRWFTRFLVGLIITVTVFVGPLVLFWMIQHRFATGGDMSLMPLHLGLLTVDVLALIIFRAGLAPRRPRAQIVAGIQSLVPLFALYLVFLTASVKMSGEFPSSMPHQASWWMTDTLRPRLNVENECLTREDIPVAREFCDQVTRQAWFSGVKTIEEGQDNLTTWVWDNSRMLCQQGQRLDLSQRKLSRGRFSGAIMPCVQLLGANLAGADLLEASLPGAILDRSSLSYSKLPFANLVRAHMNFTDLYAADFQKADLTGAGLRQSTLWGSSFPEAQMVGTLFENADIVAADFIGTHLTGANLGAADRILYASFVKATLSATDWEGLQAADDNLVVFSDACFASLLATDDRLKAACAGSGNDAVLRPNFAFIPSWGLLSPPEADDLILASSAYLSLQTRSVLKRIGCFHRGHPPIDSDGLPMTTEDMPHCEDPRLRERYRRWECAHVHFDRVDPWTERDDPFRSGPSTCDGVASIDDELRDDVLR